jgi:acyl-CoA thioester hydrolase
MRVRYKETDQMGIAHHANYVVWFEVGRTDLCRDAGFSYREIEERGLILVVTEIGCSYRAPFRYDDEVVVETSIGRAASRSLTFSYSLRRAGGPELFAEGFSRHVWLDRVNRTPVVAPRDIIDLFRPFVHA